MRGRLSLYLALVGTLGVLSGLGITAGLLVQRVNCEMTSPTALCEGYTNSIRWAYPIAAVGAVCFIAAVVSALWSGRRREDEPLLSPTDVHPSPH